MHLYYPHRSSQDQSCTTSFQKLLSPPRTHKATKNRAFFSIFYTAVLVFPQVCSFIYWCVLVPQHETTYPGKLMLDSFASTRLIDSAADELFEHGWYRTFYILNKYGVNNAISLIEVIFLSSIRRQTVSSSLEIPFYSSTNTLASPFGLTPLDFVHCPTSTSLGHSLAKQQLISTLIISSTMRRLAGNMSAVPSLASGHFQAHVSFRSALQIALTSLTRLVFAVLYGITGFREMLTNKCEDRNSGYSRLPQ